jgi:hypothetical protein
MVWRWQQRFAEAGVDGLLRDKTRKPGKAPIPAETVARVVALTCGSPPSEATHWTGRAMAQAGATGDIPQNVNFAIKDPVARSFLDAKGVEYETASSDRELTAAEVGKRAASFTVLVECWK